MAVNHYYHSAFGQFSTVLDDYTTIPTTNETLTTTTAPAASSGQSNNNATSAADESEGPTIVSLNFSPDGTGWLTLSTNGRLSPVIKFNHTLSPANFTDTGWQIDVNSIDFSSQITLDPNANVTLPAKPRLSPEVLEFYGSLPPSSSPPPSTTTTSPPPAVTQSAPPPTTSTSPPPPSLPPGLYSGPTSDPDLLRFNEILAQCSANIMAINPLGQGGEFQQPSQLGIDDVRQCVTVLNQAITKYCESFETYDAAKCNYVNTPNIKKFLGAAERIVVLGTGLNILEPQPEQ